MTNSQYNNQQQQQHQQTTPFNQQQLPSADQSPTSSEDLTPGNHQQQYNKGGSSSPSSQHQQHGAGTVFVGGISYKVDEEQLKQCFERYGAVTEVRIIRDKFNFNQSKGYGFVTFEDPQSAETVKNEAFVEFMGKTMNVGDAYRGGTRGGLGTSLKTSPTASNRLSSTSANRYASSPIQSTVYYNTMPYQYMYANYADPNYNPYIMNSATTAAYSYAPSMDTSGVYYPHYYPTANYPLYSPSATGTNSSGATTIGSPSNSSSSFESNLMSSAAMGHGWPIQYVHTQQPQHQSNNL